VKHMVINTHDAASCAFRNEENAQTLTGALDALSEAVAELGASIDGFWANRAAHTFYILIDAPSAHVVDEAFVKADLLGRTHTEIVPVFAIEEVRVRLDAGR
jgi:hypothetical protein